MSEEYTKQIEEENERLKQKLDETLGKYDSLYNDKDNLRDRIREIELEEMGNLASVPTFKTISEQLGVDVEVIQEFMKAYMKDEFDV